MAGLTHSEKFDIALGMVKAALHEAAVEFKSAKRDTRSAVTYRSWHAASLVCVLLVKHQDKLTSIECSRDGAERPRIYVPIKQSTILPESAGEFVLMLLPKWLAVRAELMGVTPDLSPDRAWTSADIDQWDTLRRLRLRINTKIYFARRRPTSNISRSDAA
ncbi:MULTISPECIES: hypothetical protein [unclassified Bradyrhizobium]